jgi:hypothetical protein
VLQVRGQVFIHYAVQVERVVTAGVVPVLGLVVHIAPVGATVRRVCAKVFTVETILAAIGSAAALALATNRMLLPR